MILHLLVFLKAHVFSTIIQIKNKVILYFAVSIGIRIMHIVHVYSLLTLYMCKK